MSHHPSARGPTAGAVVPHAPLLLPEVGGRGTHPDVSLVRRAAARLDLEGADVVIVLSPHGPGTGVYARCFGDLSGFGVEEVTVDCAPDSTTVEALASAWNTSVLDRPVDHGVLVPVKLLGIHQVPVVAACLDEMKGENASEEVARFVEAVGEVSVARRVLFVASANTSAGLTPRAPLAELPGARDIEADLRAVFERDPGGLDGLAAKLADVGGSCSRGPLTAFGALFAGRPARVLAHAWPFGVGYIVAAVDAEVRA